MDTLKHYGLNHTFTARGEEDVIHLQAGANETLFLHGTAEDVLTVPNAGIIPAFTFIEESTCDDGNNFTMFGFNETEETQFYGSSSGSEGISTISAIRSSSDLFETQDWWATGLDTQCGEFLISANLFKGPDYSFTGRFFDNSAPNESLTVNAVLGTGIRGPPDELLITSKDWVFDAANPLGYTVYSGSIPVYEGFFPTPSSSSTPTFDESKVTFDTNKQVITLYRKWLRFQPGTYFKVKTVQKPVRDVTIYTAGPDQDYIYRHHSRYNLKQALVYDLDGALITDIEWNDEYFDTITWPNNGLYNQLEETAATGVGYRGDRSPIVNGFFDFDEKFISKIVITGIPDIVVLADDVILGGSIGPGGIRSDPSTLPSTNTTTQTLTFSGEETCLFVVPQAGFYQFEWFIDTLSNSKFCLAGIIDGKFQYLSAKALGDAERTSNRMFLNEDDYIGVFIIEPFNDGWIELGTSYLRAYTSYSSLIDQVDRYRDLTVKGQVNLGNLESVSTIKGNVNVTSESFDLNSGTFDLTKFLKRGELISSINFTLVREANNSVFGVSSTKCYKIVDETITTVYTGSGTMRSVDIDKYGNGYILSDGAYDAHTTNFGDTFTTANINEANLKSARYFPKYNYFSFVGVSVNFEVARAIGRSYVYGTTPGVKWKKLKAPFSVSILPGNPNQIMTYNDIACDGTVFAFCGNGSEAFPGIKLATNPFDQERDFIVPGQTQVTERTVEGTCIIHTDLLNFVCVGGSQLTYQLVPGGAWTSITMTYTYKTVIWVEELRIFIAVGTAIAYSYTGISWTEEITVDPRGLAWNANSVAFNNPFLYISAVSGLYKFNLDRHDIEIGDKHTTTKVLGDTMSLSSNTLNINSDVITIGNEHSIIKIGGIGHRMPGMSVGVLSNKSATINLINNWDVCHYDSHSNFDFTTGKYTIPIHGIYNVCLTGVNINNTRIAWIMRESGGPSTTTYNWLARQLGAGVEYCSLYVQAELHANDVIYAWASHSSLGLYRRYYDNNRTETVFSCVLSVPLTTNFL